MDYMIYFQHLIYYYKKKEISIKEFLLSLFKQPNVGPMRNCSCICSLKGLDSRHNEIKALMNKAHF